MRLLSQELVSLEYREQLQPDLARASVCRFMVAYISQDGLDTIGRHLLTRVLRDTRSFGVGSLSCSCRYAPLLRLQGELDPSIGVRLKYFMDPLLPGGGEPDDLVLFHSKLVYLLLEREEKSVVYIGSHNWTRRALGPRGPRNAEVSLRIELDYAPEDLDDAGSSIASDVNKHLLQAFNLPACLPATAANETRFEQWYQMGCRAAPSAALQQVTVLLGVRKDDGTPVAPSQWQALAGQGIYFQALEEEEGSPVWKSNDRVLLLVWKSQGDLVAGNQPMLLHCRVTTSKAGPNSRLQGTNQSTAPVAGFKAVLFDEAQLAATSQSKMGARSAVTIWSGRSAELFDFEFPTTKLDSSQVDGNMVPKYQFHLEVETVIFPAEAERPDDAQMVWTRESFAVAKSKDSARYEEVPGYEVPPDVQSKIMDCLTHVLLIEPDKARVLPVSEYDRAKVGKRVSAHSLHETFLGGRQASSRDEFYGKVEHGSLVADLDYPPDSAGAQGRGALFDERVSRVQRVFTTPLNQLEAAWRTAANQHRTNF
jgi:hypothetical protein